MFSLVNSPFPSIPQLQLRSENEGYSSTLWLSYTRYVNGLWSFCWQDIVFARLDLGHTISKQHRGLSEMRPCTSR